MQCTGLFSLLKGDLFTMVMKNVLMVGVGLILAGTFVTDGSAQQVISVQPMATSGPAHAATSPDSYYCAKCGRMHSRSGGDAISQPTASTQLGRLAGGGTSNVLAALNSQRAQQGVGALAPDGQLQAVAEQRAQLMASTGIKSHPPGSYAPGRYEGVGWSSSYSPSAVSACFTSDPSMRVAGAAMATGRDGVYFCVVYR